MAGKTKKKKYKLKLKKADLERIEQAVIKAEKKTNGEIVPMILKRSDLYPAAHFRCAIFIALSASMIYYFLPFIPMPDPVWMLYIQLPGLLLGYLLAFHPRITRFFSTKKEMREEVHQRAIEGFFKHGLHTTKDRTGVLLMVSLLERRVEILADSGINSQVTENTWELLVSKLVTEIKKGNLTNGICQAIGECGEILAKHFPKEANNTNELSNELVTTVKPETKQDAQALDTANGEKTASQDSPGV